MHRLPIDVIEYIRTLTYKQKVQDADLLADIRSFVETHDRLIKLYTRVYTDGLELESPEELEWLYNDLISYFNEDIALMDRFAPRFYAIFGRNGKLAHIADGEELCSRIEMFPLKKTIALMIGLMTVTERQEFVNQVLVNFSLTEMP